MDSIDIIFTGDLAPIRNFDSIMAGAEPLSIYGDVLPVLQGADYCVANLESPLAGNSFIAKSGAAFTGRPEHIAALAPFKAVTLANNHTFDTGVNGFKKTIELLDKEKIQRCGAGMTQSEAEKPVVLQKDNLSIAIFSISEGEDMLSATTNAYGVNGWNIPAFCENIKKAKSSGAYSAVIAVVHCGLEYYPYPPYYVYEAFQQIAKAGADLIIGHHVHVPQGACRFGNTPAFFSLGNFVFYQENQLLHRKTGYMVKATVSANGVNKAVPIPYRITPNGVRLLNTKEGTDFAALFEELSAPLKNAKGAKAAWEACLAYYGIAGFSDELRRIADKLQNDPVKGAAMLRNRLHCMQHKMQWTDGMNRIIAGQIDKVNEHYLNMVRRYFTETLA